MHKNWTAYSPKGKVSQYMKLKGSIQEYVRETFDRIYEKNHEENASSPHKQSEQEKSTIVRRLLNNLESIRDQVLIKQN